MKRSAVIVLLGAGVVSAACEPGGNDANEVVRSSVTVTAQANGRVFSAGLVDGHATAATSWDLPPTAWRTIADPPGGRPMKADSLFPSSSSRVSPALERDAADLEAGRRSDRSVRVVVTFGEDLAVPRLPSADPTLARSAPANQAALQTARAMVADLQKQRATGLNQLASELHARHGAVEVGRFWLIKAMTMDVPLSAVRAISSRNDVQYVEYDQTGTPPPSNNIVDARTLMNTDYYRDLNGWFIGLLDTGIRTTHTVLSDFTTQGSFIRDCVNGTSDACSTGSGLNPEDDFWNHGTSSANIIFGNNNLGNNSLGVAGIITDSWKIYSSGGLDTSAALRGFEAAVSSLDKVIVGEIQASGSETSSLSAAADSAYDMGVTVVAAAGNFGSGSGSVTSPGNAQKALAIGAVDVSSLALQSYSGRGPAPDSRIKPDLVGPTNVYAAANSGDTAVHQFGGTSCATPHASAATALARNFIRDAEAANDIDPGLVNAFMILGGTQRAFDNDQGAGLVTIPTGGWFWWGSVTVTNGQTVDIPLNTNPTQHMNAAIWWPESPSTHNDVDLSLLKPDSNTADSSVTSVSVFEKVSATSNLSTGTWTVRITGFSVTGTQTVYWAVHKL